MYLIKDLVSPYIIEFWSLHFLWSYRSWVEKVILTVNGFKKITSITNFSERIPCKLTNKTKLKVY